MDLPQLQYDEDVEEDDCEDKTDGTGYWMSTVRFNPIFVHSFTPHH